MDSLETSLKENDNINLIKTPAECEAGIIFKEIKKKPVDNWKSCRRWFSVNIAFFGAVLIIAIIIYALIRGIYLYQKYRHN